MASQTLTIAAREPQPNGAKVIGLAGDLTLETVAGFNQQLRSESARELVLDFSGVNWLDSAGVGALVQLLVRRSKENGQLALAGLSVRNRAVLEVAQVLKLFVVFASAEEAVNSFH